MVQLQSSVPRGLAQNKLAKGIAKGKDLWGLDKGIPMTKVRAIGHIFNEMQLVVTFFIFNLCFS